MSTACPTCGAVDAWDGKSCARCPPATAGTESQVQGYGLWAAVTVGLGWLSWSLDSNDFWRWSVLLSGTLVGAIIWHEALKKLDHFFKTATKAGLISFGCWFATWLAWTLPGFIYPGIPVRLARLPETDVRIVYDGAILATLEKDAIAYNEYSFRRRGFDPAKCRLEAREPQGWVPLETTTSKDPRPSAPLFYSSDVLIEVQ